MTQTLKINGGWWQFIAPLRKRAEFRTGGSMRGEPTPHGAGTLGRLPAEYHASARTADYVVYSYVTPIAWHVPADVHTVPDGATSYADGWVMPEESYSVTTSKQQGRIRTALSVLWDTAYDRYAEPEPSRPRTRTTPAARDWDVLAEASLTHDRALVATVRTVPAGPDPVVFGTFAGTYSW